MILLLTAYKGIYEIQYYSGRLECLLRRSLKKLVLKIMNKIKSKIESLLFIASKPLSYGKIADLIKEDKEKTKEAVDKLIEEYKERDGGVLIVKNLMSYQMMTSPENSQIVKDFSKSEFSGELTQPALETLTIIAYRGPISRPELEQIRGVNCGLIIKNLTIRGLINADKGKNIKNIYEGNPKDFLDEELYYNITIDFLKYLGISRIEDLPDYKNLNGEEILAAVDRESREVN
jgi:segregation and condensation protein B